MNVHPGQQLKWECEQRGWSQNRVLDKTGIHKQTMSRYKSVHASAPIYTFPLFNPSLPLSRLEVKQLIGRETIVNDLLNQLCHAERGNVLALAGLPGVGKTTLVTSLAHNSHIHTHFGDGILWAGLGPQVQVAEYLNHWGCLLGLAPLTHTQKHDLHVYSKLLRDRIGQRRFLFILDNIWKVEDALQLLHVAGPNCRCLITTRFPFIGTQVAGTDGTILLPELNEQDRLALLSLLAPQSIEQYEDARALVDQAGGLPLALVLLGKYLLSKFNAQQPFQVHAALSSLNEMEQYFRLQMPLPSCHDHSFLTHTSSLSLHACIALSIQHLPVTTQSALRTLSLFPAKPASFSEAAAATLLQEGIEHLKILCDAGLLENCGNGHYMLHQVVADYARSKQINSL